MDDAIRARAELMKREKRTQSAILKQFQILQEKLKKDLDEIVYQISVAKKAGIDPAALFFEQAKIIEILQGIGPTIDPIADKIAGAITDAQIDAIGIAKKQAIANPELRTEGIRFFDLPSTKEIAGSAGNGSPLKFFLKELKSPVRQAIYNALTEGIAAGQTNQEIAAALRASVPKGAINAMTTARTETNRVYRETNRKFFDDVPAVKGWRWIAALDLRTCPICWRFHGKIFPTSEKFWTHPNCRCTMTSVGKSTPDIETGVARFDKLSQAQQTAILGPGKYRLFASGEFGLKDFVGERETDFGISRFIVPTSGLTT